MPVVGNGGDASSPGHPSAAAVTAKPFLSVAYRATGNVRAKPSSWQVKAHFCALGVTERRRLAAKETPSGGAVTRTGEIALYASEIGAGGDPACVKINVESIALGFLRAVEDRPTAIYSEVSTDSARLDTRSG